MSTDWGVPLHAGEQDPSGRDELEEAAVGGRGLRERYADELVERASELLATGRTEIGLAVVTMVPPSREIDLDAIAPGELLGMMTWADEHGLPVGVWHRGERVALIVPDVAPVDVYSGSCFGPVPGPVFMWLIYAACPTCGAEAKQACVGVRFGPHAGRPRRWDRAEAL